MPTLEQLSGVRLPEPGPDATSLVRRCTSFARTDLDELSDEGVRTLISQQMFLKWLLPIAVVKLRENFWIEGDLYPGALLKSVAQAVHHADAAAFRDSVRQLVKDALADQGAINLPDYLKSALVLAVGQVN